MVQEEKRYLDCMQWGLKPKWKKDGPLTNAWFTTAPDKRTLAQPFRAQRCLIPTLGFYEWKKSADGKDPYHIKVRDERYAWMAALYDDEQAEGGWVRRFVILLCEPNEILKAIGHDMQPVFLDESGRELWFDPDAPVEALRALGVTLPASAIVAEPLARMVNKTSNTGVELLTPIGPPLAT